MKKNYLMTMVASLMVVAAMCSLGGCSTSSDEEGTSMYALDGEESVGDKYAYESEEGGGGGDSQGGNTSAGVVTAGEWNDLSHWPFWSGLMLGEDYGDKSAYWQLFTNNRVAVQVTDNDGRALAGVEVKLLRQTDGRATTLWEAVTDNHGLADCWVGVYQKEDAKADNLAVSIDGEVMDGHPVVCHWDSLAQNVTLNHYSISTVGTDPQADIAFIVDATGSMGDEIDFLKNDLEDIIGKVSTSGNMRTAALFYRDEGDDYLTRHSNFTTDVQQTAKFVGKQRADGGGDYPEAVHTALERMLQDLSWNENARTRIAFMLLDAPAHYEDAVIKSLQQSLTSCAKMGIRIIPVAASGVDKNTEFMLRFFANLTGGTYVFLTDDSGVGFSHLKASVGDYKVELLNNLLIRLIEYYTE